MKASKEVILTGADEARWEDRERRAPGTTTMWLGGDATH